MEVNVKRLPVQIVNIRERGEVDLDIGGNPACLIEPKPALVHSYSIVPICDVDILNGPFWEKLVSVKLHGRTYKGCTDDPRIVDIAKRQIEGRLTREDIGTVYPPLEENSQK